MIFCEQVGSGLKENAIARIISPAYTANNGEQKCLEFYYHMNVSSLAVHFRSWLQIKILKSHICEIRIL